MRYFLAKLGLRTLQEAIGRTDLLYASPNPVNGKAKLLEFEKLLRNALSMYPDTDIRGGSMQQDFALEKRLDYKVLHSARMSLSMPSLLLQVIEAAKTVLETGKGQVTFESQITNNSRTFGATLSYEISKCVARQHVPRCCA